MLEYNIDLSGKTILVTGAAGFIGSNLSKRLLSDFEGIKVIGIDSITDYYDVNLKNERLQEIESLSKDWTFIKGNIADKALIYSTDDKVDNPVSLYAATKKSNELMAYAYSKLYNIPSTGLRFFTVYGPAGRPDMAYFGFTDKLVKGDTIKIFNYGNCKRDFTYIDDIVEGVVRVMRHAPEKRTGENSLPIPPYKVYNIDNNRPENLLDFVTILQEELIRAGVLPADYDFDAHKELVPMQPGDVPVTYADITPLEQDFGFKPSTPLREGLRRFAEWYRWRSKRQGQEY